MIETQSPLLGWMGIDAGPARCRVTMASDFPIAVATLSGKLTTVCYAVAADAIRRYRPHAIVLDLDSTCGEFIGFERLLDAIAPLPRFAIARAAVGPAYLLATSCIGFAALPDAPVGLGEFWSDADCPTPMTLAQALWYQQQMGDGVRATRPAATANPEGVYAAEYARAAGLVDWAHDDFGALSRASVKTLAKYAKHPS